MRSLGGWEKTTKAEGESVSVLRAFVDWLCGFLLGLGFVGATSVETSKYGPQSTWRCADLRKLLSSVFLSVCFHLKKRLTFPSNVNHNNNICLILWLFAQCVYFCFFFVFYQDLQKLFRSKDYQSVVDMIWIRVEGFHHSTLISSYQLDQEC